MPVDRRRMLNALIRSGVLLASGPFVLPSVGFSQTSSSATSLSSSVNGVTVKVASKMPGPADERWEFNVVLDTHSGELTDDLMASAVLTTPDGRTLKPVAWTGAGPGGHHREGVLAFDVPLPRPAAVELKLARPGETQARVFRWQL